MSPIFTMMPTLAVSVIFCLYNAVRQFRLRRVRCLHERVAYMLWVMANQTE
jgi:hypothetical protein